MRRPRQGDRGMIVMQNFGDFIEQLRAWRLLESDIRAFPLLIFAVFFALAGNIAAASLVGGLFVAVVLFRTLPRMKSWKGFGLEIEWFQEVTKNHHISTAGTAEL